MGGRSEVGVGEDTASLSKSDHDGILPRKRPITRAMSKRLQEDWARAVEEGSRVLMNLRIDF